MNYVYINENNTSKNDLKLKNNHAIKHNAALAIAKRYVEEFVAI
jgi:hypothetical protein